MHFFFDAQPRKPWPKTPASRPLPKRPRSLSAANFFFDRSLMTKSITTIDNFWDFSTLPKDHLYYTPTTANQLGLFKLETGADKIFACAGNIIDKKLTVNTVD